MKHETRNKSDGTLRGEGCGTLIGSRRGSGPCGEFGLCSYCWDRAEARDALRADGRDDEDIERILAALGKGRRS